MATRNMWLPGPHHAPAECLVVHGPPVREQPGRGGVRRVEHALRQPQHGAQERVLRGRQDQVPDAGAVHHPAVEAMQARRRVHDRPPEEHGRPEERQVLDVVEHRIPERGLVGRRVMPAPERHGVEHPRDRHPRERLQAAPDRSRANHERAHAAPKPRRQRPQDHRERRGQQEQRRSHHHEQLMLHHVRREGELGQELDGRAEGDDDGRQADQVGSEPPARRSPPGSRRPAEPPPAPDVERRERSDQDKHHRPPVPCPGQAAEQVAQPGRHGLGWCHVVSGLRHGEEPTEVGPRAGTRPVADPEDAPGEHPAAVHHERHGKAKTW